MRRIAYFLPILVFVGLAAFFYKGLGLNPRAIPSELIDKPVPDLALPGLPGRDEEGLTDEDLKGQVSLVNVFGSWCIACKAEHPMLMEIKKSGFVPLHGIDWREDPAAGWAWLQRYGDPYDKVGADPTSHAAVDFGVTGAPETFVVDAGGIIRYKHVGPITQEVWEGTLKPLIEALRK